MKSIPISQLRPTRIRKDCTALKKSIQSVGLQNPILVRGNRIIDGSQRYYAFKELGYPEIPCFVQYTYTCIKTEGLFQANVIDLNGKIVCACPNIKDANRICEALNEQS